MMVTYDVSSVGFYVLDILGRPVTRIPDGGRADYIEEIRMTVAGTAGAIAVDCAILGLKTQAVATVGSDDMGDFLVAKMEKFGVDCRMVARHSTTQTSATILRGIYFHGSVASGSGERSALAPDYLFARRVTPCPPPEHDVLPSSPILTAARSVPAGVTTCPDRAATLRRPFQRALDGFSGQGFPFALHQRLDCEALSRLLSGRLVSSPAGVASQSLRERTTRIV
jgi:hypothetical protein